MRFSYESIRKAEFRPNDLRMEALPIMSTIAAGAATID
jgi:hypothetical protein